MSRIFIKCQELHAGKKAISKDLNLTVEKGSRIAIVARSGVGKTTFFRKLLSREIEVNHDVSWSYLAQSNGLPFWLSGVELCRLLSCNVDLFEESLNVLGISDLQNNTVSSLSGGQYERMGLALVLSQPCNGLIIDEPFTALDIRMKRTCLEFLVEKSSMFRFFLFSSHDIEVLYSLATQIVIMDELGFSELYNCRDFPSQEKLSYWLASQLKS